VRATRLARVFEGRDTHGRPVLGTDRQALTDAEERRLVVGFLDGGVVLLAGGPLVPDELDPDRPPVVPLGYATDGVWVWSAQLRYYVAEYGVSPEPEFLTHIRRCEYRAAVPSPIQVEQANAELQEHFRQATSGSRNADGGRSEPAGHE
jgi:hypothetical protein